MRPKEEWLELWDRMHEIWPRTAQMGFPKVTSTATEWIAVAKKEPVQLLHLVQKFHYAADLLAAMSEEVREMWTTDWRKDCIVNGIAGYRIRTGDKVTRVWLEDWKRRIQHHQSQKQGSPEDAKEDWLKMRSRGYGKDEVLKLCDPANKGRLANHLLCALVYEKEIRIMTDREDESDNGGRTRLVRHLQALNTVLSFRFRVWCVDIHYHRLSYSYCYHSMRPQLLMPGFSCLGLTRV
jgi:hypothetical protein